MAEIKDLKENEFQSSKDIASVRTVKSDGNSGAVSLADLTQVLEELLPIVSESKKGLLPNTRAFINTSREIDCNTYRYMGQLVVSTNWKNAPENRLQYGACIALGYSPDWCIQFFISVGNPNELKGAYRVHVRSVWGAVYQTKWNQWLNQP